MSYDIGPRLGIDGEAEFRKAIHDAANTVKTLGTELAAVSSQFDRNDKSEKALTAQNEVLTRQIAAQKDRLAELQKGLEASRSKYGENDEATQKWQQTVNRAQTDLNKMSRTLTENEKDLADVKRGYNDAGQGLDEYGRAVEDADKKQSNFGANAATVGRKVAAGLTAAVAGATAAIGAGLAASIKVGSEFESSMAKASTLFGDAQVNADALNQKMVALSSSTGVAASELGNSLYNALSAGIPATDDMGEAVDFLGTSAKLAKAGFTDVDTAMSATVKTLNAYKLGTDQADRIQKILIQTQNKGITTVGELGNVLAQVTPTAAAMNVQFEQVGASLAVMTAQGTPAARATTQLNSLFAELGKSGTTAQKSLIAATAGTEYAGKSFQDLMADGVPLNEVLGLIRAKADESGKSMLDMFSSVEAGKAALSVTGENAVAFADALGAMSTEADVVGEAYDKVSNTFETNAGKIGNTVKNLGIAIYQNIDGPLADVTKELSGMADGLLTAFQEGGFSGLIEQAGTVLGQLTDMLIEGLPGMIDAGMTLLGGVGQGILDNLPQLTDAAIQILQMLVRGMIDALPEIASGAAQVIARLAQGIGEALPTLIPAAVEAVTTVVQGLIDNLPMLIDAALELITGLAQGLMDALSELLAAVPDIITGLVDALLDSIPDIVDAGIELLTSLVEDLPAIIEGLAEAAPKLILGLVSSIVEHIDDIAACGVELLVALVSNLPKIIAGIAAAVPKIVTGIVEAFGKLTGKIAEIGKNIVKGVWEGITGMVTWITDKVTGFFGGIVDGVKDFLGIHSPSRVFAEIGGNIGKGLAEGIESTEDAVLASANAIGSALERQEAELQDRLANIEAEGIARKEAESERKHREAVGKKYAELERLETVDKKKLLDEIAALEQKTQKKQSADSLKKNKDALTKKYAELETLETEKKQKLLDEIAKLEADREKELEDKRLSNYKNAVNEQMKVLQSFQKDYQKAIDNLQKNQEEMADKLSNAGALFEKTGGGLGEVFTVRNLRGDIDQINAYGDALERLKERAIPKELLSEIQGMSVEDGLNYSKRLLRMTDSQYDKYIATWQEKQEAAQRVAEAFYSDELNSLQTEFTEKIPEKLSGLKDDLNTVGQQAAQGLANGFKSQKSSVTNTIVGVLNDAMSAAKAAMQIHSPSRKWAEIGGFMAAGLGEGFTGKMRTVAEDISGSIPGAVTMRGSAAAAATATEGIVNSLAPLLEGHGGERTVIVPVYLNDREIVRAIYDPFEDERQRRGG